MMDSPNGLVRDHLMEYVNSLDIAARRLFDKLEMMSRDYDHDTLSEEYQLIENLLDSYRKRARDWKAARA